MPRHPETQALLEQALRHVLSEQNKLLKHEHTAELNGAVAALNALAMDTANAIAEGVNKIRSTAHLTRQAKEIEELVDDLSERIWAPIMIAVGAIYERIENSLKTEPGRRGFTSNIRSYYHNFRIRLLEQMLSARMLVSNSDFGDEIERIWEQFLERQLGPEFRILRGGHICDHQGNVSSQIDIIITPASAHVIIPGDSLGGRAQVLVDQVISALMVTSNLTGNKLKADWRCLQSIPVYKEKESDHVQLRDHPWPLTYILAAQSDSSEKLKEAWCAVCAEGLTRIVPQFVISLDTGFLYSGSRRWPAPRYPGNYVDADHVHDETGLYAGLGLAWLILQHQGRLAAVRRQSLEAINRYARLVDEATLRSALPATYSQRFETMFKMRPIAGVFSWGSVSTFAHNRLELHSLRRERDEATKVWEVELLQSDVDLSTLQSNTFLQFLRWFRYGSVCTAGTFIAVEEWINPKSNVDHYRKIAVFDTVSGEEKTGGDIDALNNVTDIENLAVKYPI
jgi:hypothetical protein